MKATEFTNQLKNIPEDLRIEVILYELLKNQQLEASKVEIRPEGIFYRDSERDLLEIELRKDKFGDIEKYVFKTPREGIYDALPKGVFHGPKSRKYRKNAKEISEEIRAQEAEEAAARDFFQPLEQEFFRLRIQSEEKEAQMAMGFSEGSHQQGLFEEFWNLDLSAIPSSQVTSLLYVLPLSFTYKGKLDKVSMIMGAVLKVPVSLEPSWSDAADTSTYEQAGLGECFLGIDTVLNGRLEDGLPSLKVHIGPVEGTALPDFLANGSQAYLLDILETHFLPADSRIIRKIIVDKETAQFTLTENPEQGRLGYSTLLGSII